MGAGDGTGRPPSPITFAPEERERPISPIEFASPVSPPGVDGVQPESDKVEGEAWEDLAFNETGDDDAEMAVIPGGRVEVPPPGGGGGGRGGFIHKPLSKLASSSSSIPFSPISAARTRGVTSPPTRVSQPYGTRPDEQIHITGFTLVRFTTGQILEDDYSIAWYQLAPHELVELHASRPQRGFAVAVQLARLLEVKRGPGGVLVLGGDVGAEQWWEDLGGEEAKSPGGATAKDRKGKGHAVQPLSLSLNSFSLSAANNVTPHTASVNNSANPHENSTSTNTATATTAAAAINPYSVVLTSLARHDLNAYIRPYWEGWVRCLRVVWRPDNVTSGVASGMVVRQDTKSPPVYPYSDFGHGGGMGSAMVPPLAFEELGLVGMRGMGGPYGVEDEEEEKEREKERERRKRERQMEWKERWVVIRDGWVYLCKKRNVSCFFFLSFRFLHRSFFFFRSFFFILIYHSFVGLAVQRTSSIRGISYSFASVPNFRCSKQLFSDLFFFPLSWFLIAVFFSFCFAFHPFYFSSWEARCRGLCFLFRVSCFSVSTSTFYAFKIISIHSYVAIEDFRCSS